MKVCKDNRYCWLWCGQLLMLNWNRHHQASSSITVTKCVLLLATVIDETHYIYVGQFQKMSNYNRSLEIDTSCRECTVNKTNYNDISLKKLHSEMFMSALKIFIFSTIIWFPLPPLRIKLVIVNNSFQELKIYFSLPYEHDVWL